MNIHEYAVETKRPPTARKAAPTLSFANVGMTFPDGTKAVENVTFDVAPKEFVTVVRPSGCGKSTSLRMAAGLLTQTTGEVAVNLEGIGFVFQDATLMEWRTVQSNIERAVFPYAVTLQEIPILAIVPLIGYWFGFGTSARVIVCVLIALFPIIVNMLFGLLAAPRGLHDLFTLQRVDRMTRLRKLMFPAALPAIFAGLRISAGLAVIGAIVGDFFFGRGDPGIGQLLQLYANRLMGEQLLAAIIMSSILGVAVFQLFGWIQSWAIGAWHVERDAEF